MVRGIDIAASGMVSVMNQNDIIANNLANVNTPGFKQLMPTFKNIYDVSMKVQREDENGTSSETENIGSLSAGCILDTTNLDFNQGPLKKTDGPLDLALNGEGFFMVETKTGQAYTRNGAFTVNDDGDLITRAGDKVLSESGKPINLDLNSVILSKVVVTADGIIMHNGEELETLGIVDFEDKSQLKAQGNSLFKPVNNDIKPVELENFTLTQGYIEASNSGVVESMINSITGARTYETLSKVIDTTSQTLKKAVTEVGRVVG